MEGTILRAVELAGSSGRRTPHTSRVGNPRIDTAALAGDYLMLAVGIARLTLPEWKEGEVEMEKGTGTQGAG